MKPLHRRTIGYAGVTLLIAVLGIWLYLEGGRLAMPSEGREDDVAPGPANAIEAAREVLLSHTPAGDSGAARSATRPKARVVSADGRAIEDALVTWMPFLPDWLKTSSAKPDLDWLVLDVQVTSTTTDSAGLFIFPEVRADTLAVGSVICITHPRYLARCIVLEYPAAPLVLPEQIELSDSAPLHAQVLFGDGRPAAGATVMHLIGQGDEALQPETDMALNAKRMLRRTYTSDANGDVTLSPLPGPNWVWAEDKGLRSPPWQGRPPAHFTLHLSPTFIVHGRVSTAQEATLPHDTRVHSSIRRGARISTFDRHAVRKDGSWGPAALPVINADAYIFGLQSSTLVKDEVSIEPPAAGDNVAVDFHTESGLEIQVRVLGPDDETLKAAKAVARWQRKESWHSTQGYTDENGNVRLIGLPPGIVYIGASCHGYVEDRVDPIELTSSRSEPVTVRLRRAGTIVGRCLHGDDPVRTFEIVWWSDFEIQRSTQDVWNSSDGIFRITEAPLGEVMLIAQSDDYPQSETQRVTVKPGSTAEVVLRLPDPLTGNGQIIDAITGEPISVARVHILTHHQGKKIDQHGAAWPVNSEGFFEVSGLKLGANPIEVSAHGYATRIVHATGRTGQSVEFGLVPLFAKQSVEIRLIVEGTQDLSSFAGELFGLFHAADRRFSSEGRLRYESLDPGPYTIRIIHPGGTSYQEVVFLLVPGRDTSVDVRVDSRTLLAEVIPSEGSTIPGHLLLEIQSFTGGAEQMSEYYGVPQGGRVEIRRVEGPVAIVVQTFEGEIVGATRAEVGFDSSSSIRIQLGAAPVVFRVIDQNRRSLPGVRVFLSCPGSCGGWFETRETDDEGRCTFVGLSFEAVRALLYKFPEGIMPSRLIDLRERNASSIDLVFEPDSALRVLLLERGVFASGVDTRAKEMEAGLNFPRTSSDGQGIVNFGPVGAGKWKVYIDHPGYWPHEQIVGVDASSGPAPIEVRRLGNVEFEVRTPYGNPASGVAIDLHSEEMNEWVSAWVQAGRVPTPASGLETDSNGRLRVNALPNGRFRWRATTDNGEVIEGEVIVPPHGTPLVALTAP